MSIRRISIYFFSVFAFFVLLGFVYLQFGGLCLYQASRGKIEAEADIAVKDKLKNYHNLDISGERFYEDTYICNVSMNENGAYWNVAEAVCEQRAISDKVTDHYYQFGFTRCGRAYFIESWGAPGINLKD